MAKFVMELPNDIIADFRKIYNDYDKIVGEMTRAGAEVVYNNIKANLPESLRKSLIMGNLRITRTYKTPTDGGTNTKVGFYGYFLNENGEKTPAPLVANVYEYGRSDKPFPKQPFFRKAFRGSQIEDAMYEAQVKASGGLLK